MHVNNSVKSLKIKNKLIINKAGKLVSFTNHSKVCVPISTEINGLPNIFLGAVNSKTDTSVNQTFKVKDNTKDYDGIKVVLSTKLDDVLVTINKNETGEYNWDFPILEKASIRYSNPFKSIEFSVKSITN